MATKSDKRKSGLFQFTTAIIIILFGGVFLLWSILNQPPIVFSDIDHTKYQIEMRCNTGLHINIQIALLIVQHLITSIQAYRGRNLPGPFNDAMPIAYSTLTMVFIYLIVFPLFYLQNDNDLKQHIHLLILSIAQTLFVIIFYGPKLFIILFRKDKNTKVYVRAKMWEKSKNQVNLKT